MEFLGMGLLPATAKRTPEPSHSISTTVTIQINLITNVNAIQVSRAHVRLTAFYKRRCALQVTFDAFRLARCKRA